MFGIGEAVGYLKNGQKVYRLEWENNFLYLVKGSGLFLPIDKMHICSFPVHGDGMELWKPTQADVLADDWAVYQGK